MSFPKAKVVTVWSPSGSPGRTTIAACIASELAKQGHRTLIIDADSYAPSIEFQFGIEQSHAGIAAVARFAIQERLDLDLFQKHTVDFSHGKVELKILTGLSIPDRWQEVGFDGINAILDFAEEHFCLLYISDAADD